MKITKVDVYDPGMGAVSLNCVSGTERYHIWVDRKTRKMFNNKLYKNSVAEYGKLGYHSCRVLRADSSFGKKLIAAMWSEAQRVNAFTAAAEKVRAKNDAEDKKRQAQEAAERVAKAAPQMLAALEAADNDAPGWGFKVAEAIKAAKG